MYRPSYEMAGLTPTALAFDPFLSVSMISLVGIDDLGLPVQAALESRAHKDLGAALVSFCTRLLAANVNATVVPSPLMRGHRRAAPSVRLPARGKLSGLPSLTVTVADVPQGVGPR
jgi:hypothetical protein